MLTYAHICATNQQDLIYKCGQAAITKALMTMYLVTVIVNRVLWDWRIISRFLWSTWCIMKFHFHCINTDHILHRLHCQMLLSIYYKSQHHNIRNLF